VKISVLRGVGCIQNCIEGGSLKKVLILLRRLQHKSTSDHVGAPKNNQFGAILIDFGDTKKCVTLSGLELVPKSRKKLIGGLSCMHKGQKCIQILWDHQKKMPFVEKYKECGICKGKKHILGHTQRLKKVLRMLRCAKHAPQRPKNNANPLGLSEKNVLLSRKSAIFR